MTSRASSADPATAEAIGELRAQVREMIHNVGNDGQQLRAIARSVAKLENLPSDINEIKERLTALERDKDRRDGAMGFGAWLAKSPLVAWLLAAAVVMWTWLKEQGQ